ncbi:MAG: saccharopine dehydrogenase NADP-binding domain-containing protein [Polyangia bacterium]
MSEPGSGPRGSRAHDIVLFGATGFTGQLVAEYLARQRPEGLRWALGGRSRDKLERVRSGLAAIDGRLAELPLVLADSNDEAALQRLAASTRVVCTTAGPFVLHGKKLLAACAEAGTDYCDITGEVPFIRWAIDTQQARAKESGARIVSCCGFDSLPSDLGVLLLAENLQQRGAQLAAATLAVERVHGELSGGTLASMMNLMEEASRDRGLRRLLASPYALVPERESERDPKDAELRGVRWDEELRRWTAPFVMAAINTRVVRRSNALLGHPYGRSFRYSEVMAFPRGPKGLALAAGLTGGLGLFMLVASSDRLRPLVAKRLPAPGQGPSQAEREAGLFRVRLIGQSAPDASGRVLRAQARVEANGDPGYSETAKMLAESALCLALDELPAPGGILTPSVCLGHKLIERLRRRDMVWSVESI